MLNLSSPSILVKYGCSRMYPSSTRLSSACLCGLWFKAQFDSLTDTSCSEILWLSSPTQLPTHHSCWNAAGWCSYLCVWTLSTHFHVYWLTAHGPFFAKPPLACIPINHQHHEGSISIKLLQQHQSHKLCQSCWSCSVSIQDDCVSQFCVWYVNSMLPFITSPDSRWFNTSYI